MFYDLVLFREQHEGRLSVAWMSATIGPKYNKKKVLSVDVCKLCDDILKYLMSTSQVPRERFSLRLSAILLYGTARIFQAQTVALYTTVSNTMTLFHQKQAELLAGAIESRIFETPPTPVPKTKPKRKKTAPALAAAAVRSILEKERIEQDFLKEIPALSKEDIDDLRRSERQITLEELPAIPRRAEEEIIKFDQPTEVEVEEFIKGIRKSSSPEQKSLGPTRLQVEVLVHASPKGPEVPKKIPIATAVEKPSEAIELEDTPKPKRPSRGKAKERMDIEAAIEIPAPQAETQIQPEIQMLAEQEVQPRAEPEVLPQTEPEVQPRTTPKEVPQILEPGQLERKPKKVPGARNMFVHMKPSTRPIYTNENVFAEESELAFEFPKEDEFLLDFDDFLEGLDVGEFLAAGSTWLSLKYQRKRSTRSKTPSVETLHLQGPSAAKETPTQLSTPLVEQGQIPGRPFEVPPFSSTPLSEKLIEMPEILESPRKKRKIYEPSIELAKRPEMIIEEPSILLPREEPIPMDKARKSPTPQTLEERQQKTIELVRQWDYIRTPLTIEDVAEKPLTKLTVARAFADLLTLCKAGYVILRSNEDSCELKCIEPGPLLQ